MMLITMAEALDQLRVIGEPTTGDPLDFDDIQRKAEEATDIVLTYLKYEPGTQPWDDVTCPFRVKAAIKLVLSNLYDERDGDPLANAVHLLRLDRRPTLA